MRSKMLWKGGLYSLMLLVAFLVPCSVGGTSDVEPEEGMVEYTGEGAIKVGMGRANITPPWPVKSSYGYQAPTDSLYNREIYVKVLILQVEDLRRALVVFDLIGLGL
ncbi:MAG: hypothetical protein V1800_12655, partial [Candidatus Latescibacterota bacterium]